MNEYYFFIERLNSKDDKEIKISSMPFNVTVMENLCNLQMIRDINFSFLTKPCKEYIFRIIAVKKYSKYLQKALSNLINFLELNNNELPNDQDEYILVKEFKMNMESNEESQVEYKDDYISCKFWKHDMKNNEYFYSNPQIEIDYIKLIELVNNFINMS